MKLSEKGRFAVRPRLDGAAEGVARTIEAWPSVIARTHWELGDETVVDGADFYVGERELGHLHLYAEAHVVVPLAVRKALVAAKLAKPFQWSEQFVIARVKTAADARRAEWIFTLAYDRLTGTPVAELLARVGAEANAKVG